MDNNKVGWAYFTQADYIFYGDSRNKRFYVFSSADMRDYLDTHKGEYETRIASDYRMDGTVRKKTLGAIVPIGRFKRAVKMQEIDIE